VPALLIKRIAVLSERDPSYDEGENRSGKSTLIDLLDDNDHA